VRAEVALVAPQTIPVLVLGPTGVGKELVAAELHEKSGRSGAFVAVNCAALPPALAESELFGHVAGAFTGSATRGGEGLFAAARGGTLFLDEVGELPEPVQAKLLRALATGEIRAVGASENRRVDVRIVAATHRELAAPAFRDDLRARLQGWIIRVPPLAERREDILPLALAFLRREGRAQPSTDAAEALLLHDWPLNVRELEQVMRAAAVRAGGGWQVHLAHLPPELAARLHDRKPAPAWNEVTPEPVAVAALAGASGPGAPAAAPGADDEAAAPSKDELVALLRQARGSVSDVARALGKDRRQIYRWLKRHGLDPDDFRAG
jgi:DNA-binding NtrC family response regulator